jgi:DNA mismatch repair protein MutS
MKKKEEETSIYKEYFDSTIQYTLLHGEKTIVFMQVGSFYEMYGLKYIDSDEIKGSLIAEIAELVGLAISSKKYTYAGGTIYMSGFRDYTLEKYIPTIIEQGYVIVEIIQAPETGEITNKKKTRILNAVYSAGTYLTYDTNMKQQLTNNIMCIWMEIHNNNKTKQNKIIYGVAVLNIYTGESFIFEHETENWMNPTTFDELERYISIYSPSEMIFIYSLLDQTIDKILKFIKPPPNMILHKINVNVLSENLSGIQIKDNKKVENIQVENANKCTKQKYIQYILSSFFGEEIMQLCSEFSYNIYATQAYCYLLHFIQEHNSNYGKKVILPIFHNITNKMKLANHTLKQLNIIDDYSDDGKKQGQLSSVLSFLNKCKTSMGKRRFQTQLTQPVSDEIWLENEYDMIAFFLESQNEDILECFRKLLIRIKDIDKISRQLLCRKIYPSSIYDLYQSILIGQQIAECMHEMPIPILKYFFVTDTEEESIHENMREILLFFETKLKVEVCNGFNNLSSFPENLICKSISPELDTKINELDINKIKLEKIHCFLTNIIQQNQGIHQNKQKDEDTTEYIKITETDKNGISFNITKTRGDLLLKLLHKQPPTITFDDDIIIVKEIKIINGKTNSEIDFPLLTKICNEITSLKNDIQKMLSVLFMKILDEIENKYYDKISRISKFISKIDVILCKSHLAKTYRYCRPVISSDNYSQDPMLSNTNKSFVDAKDLRHVLIEHLQQNEIYVTNDICLGRCNSETGMLLYGTNAVGKTSLIRALGISLIMAQSGMYVPCSSFHYKPYNAMYSRILSNDNLFKGLSTFAVEISELRVILINADENSFVLGDELCSGTETESALGIFMSSLQHLHQKKSSFIFATHFHEIADYEELQKLDGIGLKHLEVRYDRETDSLIYDRKIKNGVGNRMYGLEVCKSLYLPEHIIEYAYHIRNKYASHPNESASLSHNITQYNARKIRGICEKCCKKMGEEIHHLQPQKDTDLNGYLNGEKWVHKNHPANLLSLCSACHDELHRCDHHLEDEISEITSSSIYALNNKQKKQKKISVK